MRMSHLASIAFACSISIFATASLAQQSSNDGRCDVLSDDATPSLYGLCIAYWATQENGNSEASSKIYRYSSEPVRVFLLPTLATRNMLKNKSCRHAEMVHRVVM